MCNDEVSGMLGGYGEADDGLSALWLDTSEDDSELAAK